MSLLLTPRADGAMTAYERFLTKVYAGVIALGALVLIADMTVWRPDAGPICKPSTHQSAKASKTK